MPTAAEAKPRVGPIRGIGPAIITASVVLGPGSILSASRIGYQHGYTMTWVLVIAVLLMMGITALSARLGVVLEETLCAELARRVGRPAAALTGLSLFAIAACFQFGNNLGVVAAIQPFLPAGTGADGPPWVDALPLGLIILVNAIVIVALYGFRQLYQPLERLMKLMVSLMVVGFVGNLLLAQPRVVSVLGGLVPRLPPAAAETLLPRQSPSGEVIDHWTPVVALFVTTFSIGGAFYQSYLVRKKGWTPGQLRQGLIDSTVGILVLGLVTGTIMVTAAAVLHDNPQIDEPQSAADVARQLEPLFGPAAEALFCLGIFAGAFSSFLVNAMIGGTALSDGLGLGGDIDHRWPRACTVLTLLIGMAVAVMVQRSGSPPVRLIIFAQAMTVLGLPALACTLAYLATRRDLTADRRVPGWMRAVALLAVPLVGFLALRTAILVYYALS